MLKPFIRCLFGPTKEREQVVKNYLLVNPCLQRHWGSYLKLHLHWLLFGWRERRFPPCLLSLKHTNPVNSTPLHVIQNDAILSKQRKHLVIVCAGKDSLHRQWLKLENEKTRNWDLLLIQYGGGNNWKDDATFYAQSPGIKFGLISRCSTFLNPLLNRYKLVALWDDDLLITDGTLTQMFDFAEKHNLSLCQAALHDNKNFSWDITKRRKDVVYRETTFVEIMAPIMKTSLLLDSLSLFSLNPLGWYIDTVFWPHHVLKQQGKIAVIDAFELLHTKPLGKGSLKQLTSSGNLLRAQGFLAMVKAWEKEGKEYSYVNPATLRVHKKV